jgi:hypothetical protein
VPNDAARSSDGNCGLFCYQLVNVGSCTVIKNFEALLKELFDGNFDILPHNFRFINLVRNFMIFNPYTHVF